MATTTQQFALICGSILPEEFATPLDLTANEGAFVSFPRLPLVCGGSALQELSTQVIFPDNSFVCVFCKFKFNQLWGEILLDFFLWFFLLFLSS